MSTPDDESPSRPAAPAPTALPVVRLVVIAALAAVLMVVILYATTIISIPNMPEILTRTGQVVSVVAAIVAIGGASIATFVRNSALTSFVRTRRGKRLAWVAGLCVVAVVAASVLAWRPRTTTPPVVQPTAGHPRPTAPTTAPAPSPTPDAPPPTTPPVTEPPPVPVPTPVGGGGRPSPGTPNPYRPSHATLVLNDPMTSGSRWQNLSDNTGTCPVRGDGLHATATNKYHECYNNTSATDYTYEVQFSFGTARAAGLFFRQSGPGSWYLVEIGRSGHVWLGKGVAGNPEPDLAEAYLSAPDPGTFHTLAVVAHGTSLTVHLDGGKVLAATDPTFSRGSIGVFTDGGRAPDGVDPVAESVFRNARVWTP
ncbi:family 16 glycoside hydrolase [Longispora urticae]